MNVDIKVPSSGESVTEAEIASWNKKDGDIVALDEVILELETEKATLPVAATAAGKLSILKTAGSNVKVGEVIGHIDTSVAGAVSATVSAPAPAPAAAPSKPAAAQAGYASGHPSPAARKIMDENNLSAGNVAGSGKDGRITKADALGASSKQPLPLTLPPAVIPVAPLPAPASSNAFSGERSVRREKMTMLRKTIANRLVQVKQQSSLLTTFNEVDMGAIMELRKAYKEEFQKKHGVGLGFMSFFSKACAQALQEFPIINASVDADSIVYHDYADIGIAVATPKGLVVPVMRNVERMSFHEIELAIKDLSEKGKNGQISIDEMSGGTFTITNGGTFGSMLSTPIVNPPQSAILGMHNIVERPVARNGQVVIRPIMYVALTYDHRIIDGADSVRFLVKVKNYLEEPLRMLVNL